MMRKSGESVKKIRFWLINFFLKKTQKQRCSELNRLRMIANFSPTLLTLQRSMAPNTKHQANLPKKNRQNSHISSARKENYTDMTQLY